MTECCETCRYGLPSQTVTPSGRVVPTLRCHRHAPTHATGPARMAWPAVRDDDWCGEWVEA